MNFFKTNIVMNSNTNRTSQTICSILYPGGEGVLHQIFGMEIQHVIIKCNTNEKGGQLDNKNQAEN